MIRLSVLLVLVLVLSACGVEAPWGTPAMWEGQERGETVYRLEYDWAAGCHRAVAVGTGEVVRTGERYNACGKCVERIEHQEQRYVRCQE